jgi:hypothetical protein
MAAVSAAVMTLRVEPSSSLWGDVGGDFPADVARG